jgi:hypothetical protein
MSEKFYAFLLRLYPSAFRRRFQAESLHLFRDRLGDEQGLQRKLRLWTDLLVDLLAGLPQAWRNTYAVPAQATAWPQGSGIPAFQSLEEEPLKPGSIVMGGLCATAALALFVFVMSHTSYHPFQSSNQRMRAASAGSQTNPGSQNEAEELDQKSRSAVLLETCFFDKLEQHPGNIGYVKLSWFADPASCTGVADAVMTRLNDTDAIIFDLRETRGGYPEMVRRMAGWLFNHSVPWYNPRAESPAQIITNPEPGSRLAHKPVFILTSSRTFSGAEHFAYNLKVLKRATIVGERTSGASHAAGGPPLPAALSAPKPIWEGSGVQPDVRVNAAGALPVAERLALEALHKN